MWLSFVKYHAAPDPATFGPPTECFAQLKIWDGRASLGKDTNSESTDSQVSFFIIDFNFLCIC